MTIAFDLSLDLTAFLFGIELLAGEDHPEGPGNVSVRFFLGPFLLEVSWGPAIS